MLRRAALGTVLLLLIATAPASAVSGVTIKEYSFTPSSVTTVLGGTVSWHNNGAFTHSSTGNAPLSLWTFDVPSTTGHPRTFKQAGAFAYHCHFHPSLMKGTIKVPMDASAGTVQQNQVTTISAATIPAPGGFRYVIQRKAPGAASFSTWKTISGKSTNFKSSMVGNWSFRSRLKRVSDGAHSGWSPTLVIKVQH